MYRKASWFFGLVLVSWWILMLGIEYTQAQTITPGQIVKWFDADGTLTDSVITESDAGNIGIGAASLTRKLLVDNTSDQGGLYVTNTNSNSVANGMEVYS